MVALYRVQAGFSGLYRRTVEGSTNVEGYAGDIVERGGYGGNGGDWEMGLRISNQRVGLVCSCHMYERRL
jgi:hypothetical protein